MDVKWVSYSIWVCSTKIMKPPNHEFLTKIEAFSRDSRVPPIHPATVEGEGEVLHPPNMY